MSFIAGSCYIILLTQILGIINYYNKSKFQKSRNYQGVSKTQTSKTQTSDPKNSDPLGVSKTQTLWVSRKLRP